MSRLLAVVLPVLAAIAYVVIQLVRPVPPVSATGTTDVTAMPGTAATLAWPSQGEAAIGVQGVGLLGVHGAQTPTPLASVTKMMTAFVVLHDHPLSATSQGPNITVSATEVTTYQQDLAGGNSVVVVQAGEQLSELQALEALLLPSGDNIATLLAIWDAGSPQAFVAKMNATAKQMGLAHTHYADASGVAPGSQSTAEDQTRLAMAAMHLPAFASVVGMAQVTLPLAGVQYNVDSQLGKNGIIGVKTGYTTSAGGCFVFAAKAKIAGKTQTVVGTVLHQTATTAQPSALTAAFSASTALLTSATPALEQATPVQDGATLGHLDAPWARSVALQATRSVTLTGLPGQHVTIRVVLPSRVSAPVAAHKRFGTAIVSLGPETATVPLVTSRALPAATLSWKLTNV